MINLFFLLSKWNFLFSIVKNHVCYTTREEIRHVEKRLYLKTRKMGPVSRHRTRAE